MGINRYLPRQGLFYNSPKLLTRYKHENWVELVDIGSEGCNHRIGQEFLKLIY